MGVFGAKDCCRKLVDACKMDAANMCGSCLDLSGIHRETLRRRFVKAKNVPCDIVGSKAEREREAAAPAAEPAAAPPLSPFQSTNRQIRQLIGPSFAEKALSRRCGPDALGFTAGPAASSKFATKGKRSKMNAEMQTRPNGKRVRRKHYPTASAASTLSMRTNVLCLGVSYPCIKSQLRAQDIDPRVLNYSDEGVEQMVELVQRSILTEMDGRDMARCLAMEESGNTMAYCVSLGNGAEYGERHLHANFNRVKLIAHMKKTWDGVKFRQIILDYFWIPRGTWVMSHWSRSLFDAILPSFVTEGMIDFSCSDEIGSRKVNSRLQADSTSGSSGGVVYLPFCFHCVKEVTAAIDNLSKYYTISFLHKSELAEHALWSATNSIDPNVMQLQFGKAIAQEEIYCKFKPQEAYSAAEDAHVTKKEVIQVLRGIEDFEDVRMIKLAALKKYDPEYRGSTTSGMVGITKGGYVGLKDPSEVVRGFNHVGKADR